jgi:dihydroflavonol-4-reductase
MRGAAEHGCNRLAAMKTLVTGATGYLGSELVRELVRQGRPVRALARSQQSADRIADTGAEIAIGDVVDPPSLVAAFDGVDRVFHLAGVVAHRASDEERLMLVNIEGSENVLAAARDAGVGRIVYTSSVSAMGPAGSPGHPRTEQHFLLDGDDGRGDFRYGRSKARGEQHALRAAEEGMDVVVVNPGFVIGPGDVHRVSSWPIEEYMRGLLRVVVRGGLSYVDARDVVTGMLAAEQQGRAGERYILTHPQGNLAYPDFFDLVGQVTGRRRRQVKLPVGVLAPPLAAARVMRLPLVPLDEAELRSSAYWWFTRPDKAQQELGFQTRPLEETISDTAAWLRADGYRKH